MKRLIFSGTRRSLTALEREYLAKRIAWYFRNLADSDPARVGVGDCRTGFDALVYDMIPGAKTFKAAWNQHGKAAGPLRNGSLVQWAALPEEQGYLVAAPHVEAWRGTKDCILQATAAGLRVNVYPVGRRG